ncbi:PTS sugar transporter subunit IIB [Miniphocaeibacter halophilus]|uniref:PTS sugar transporter subunit IIB n=1 Tax=Miniphocaeibacter halophilus TaxID=2931922 RepID=A0AC61MTD8_9FIRM|nr:PTS sugar transporter subunit IIB [Miniphocaeibacter halophilus]QQK08638.1 PTS sugar transporter subunit IIB [Miniphocaeibacter halophilus]
MLYIITVCGLGMGSSLIMKMTAETALKNLGLKANIEHWDMGTVKGKPRDILITTYEFKDNFKDESDVVFVHNIVDVEEMQEGIQNILEKKGEK